MPQETKPPDGEHRSVSEIERCRRDEDGPSCDAATSSWDSSPVPGSSGSDLRFTTHRAACREDRCQGHYAVSTTERPGRGWRGVPWRRRCLLKATCGGTPCAT